MTYTVKEIFYTLQGEGANAGRPAVFCRFAGCNLWTGREVDRHKAVCRFCDTDFVGANGQFGGKYRAKELASRIEALWPKGQTHRAQRFVVCTGGEPLLQLDAMLIAALKDIDFKIAIETNGTLPVPVGIDWVCVSPKAGAPLVVREGHELKVVIPQPHQCLADYEPLAFEHFFVQPMDDAPRYLMPQRTAGALNNESNTQLAIDWCKRNPKWRLSIQTHKYLNIP